jgi:hypothetical protein
MASNSKPRKPTATTGTGPRRVVKSTAAANIPNKTKTTNTANFKEWQRTGKINPNTIPLDRTRGRGSVPPKPRGAKKK